MPSAFTDWCMLHRIPAELSEALHELRLNDPEVLHSLVPQDVYELPIPLGHRLKLRSILWPPQQSAPQGPPTGPTPSHPTPSLPSPGHPTQALSHPIPELIPTQADPSESLAQLLAQLDFKGSPGGNKTHDRIQVFPTPGTAGAGGYVDVRSNLAPPKGKAPYLRITDFVTGLSSAAAREEVVIGGEGDTKLVLHSSGRKPDLQKVSQAQWSAANSKIMASLLDSGDLKADDIGFYLSYSNTVCEFALTYSWSSIMEFDDRYRALQAQFQFQWGTPNRDLEHQTLKPRAPPPPAPRQSESRKPPFQPSRPRQARQPRFLNGQELCGLYNSRGSCDYGHSCKYLHRCDFPGCGAAHPRCQHRPGPPAPYPAPQHPPPSNPIPPSGGNA